MAERESVQPSPGGRTHLYASVHAHRTPSPRVLTSAAQQRKVIDMADNEAQAEIAPDAGTGP
jgi:hypothetical protein